MSDRHPVEFIAEAAVELPRDVQARLEPELQAVIAAVAPGRPAEAITVSRCFSGYTPQFDERVVLGVEVRYADGYESHIVKLGRRDKVERDFTGWQQCTRDRTVSSRIFTPVRPVALPHHRFAVLYRDAYTLFGLNREKNQPQPLELVARWAVFDDRPDPASVERAIAHVYTDLGRWFYPGAESHRRRAAAFYREQLGTDKDETPAKQVLRLWREQPDRQDLRRDAVWVLCGRDKPGADPLAEPACYLDPVEFVDWVLAGRDGARLPDTLVGRAHGDLHARNVLLGVRRSEAEYPAVFDYGDMSDANVLAWDFAKLETELKVRLLPAVCQDDPVRERLLHDSGLRPKGQRPAADRPRSLAAERAERLGAFLAFEERLEDLTDRIQSREDAERIQPFREPPTGIVKLDRLLGLLLRVRKEAALWLGFERHKRQALWRDEYGFALAVYGLMNVRWDYEPPQAECALVAAGAAAVRMPSTPRLLARVVADWTQGTDRYPSYRVPLAVVHRYWTACNYPDAQELVERLVLDVKRDRDTGQVLRFDIRPEARHAIPLIAEAALVEMESGHFRQAEPLLDRLRPLAREFGDFETLGRIGRLFKDSGDRRWEEAPVPFEDFRDSPGWTMYRQARDVYEEACLLGDDYYPRINAATLAVLTHDTARAEEHAQWAAMLCNRMKDVPRDERYWVFATQGEAAVILGDTAAAETYFRNALAELTPGQGGMANSTYKQLCRLWKALGQDRVGPALRVFEVSEFAGSLPANYLGRTMAAAPPC
jgi:hypothetical protein